MNRACVLITKIPRKTSVNFNCLVEYQNDLTTAARNFKGYINSNSYWKQEDDSILYSSLTYNTLCNISHWETTKDWNNWYNSKIRSEIRNQYIHVLEKEQYNLLHERKNYSDIPLL